MGGYLTDNTFEVDLKHCLLIPKAQMINKKYAHTLCTADNFIFSIGGSYGNGPITECERYFIKENIWKSMPNLQNQRFWCAAFLFNNHLLYSLGGEQRVQLCTMEVLNVFRITGWKNVNVLNMRNAMRACHARQISNNEAIVFGNNSRQTYILQIGEIIKCIDASTLSVEGHFVYCTAPVFNDENVYDIDDKERIHIYSVYEKKWSVIE